MTPTTASLHRPPPGPPPAPTSGLTQLLRGARPKLDPDEVARLCVQAQAGDEVALERVVRSHLRLVVRVARRYRRQGVSLDDLVNEGNIGLMRAARKFDPSFGMPFAPYSVWWIKQAMIMFLIQHGQGAISMPIRKVQLLKRMRREQDQLKTLLGREPTLAEVADRVGKPPAELEALRRAVPEYVAWEDFHEEAGAGAGGPHPAEARVDRRRLRAGLERLIDRLPARDRRGVRLYFGLEGAGGMNYADLGRRLEMTREGARQMIQRSLKRLRTNPCVAPLTHWL